MAKYFLSAFADEAATDFDGQIKALKRNNIRFIELRAINGVPIDDNADSSAKEIAKKLSDANIGISAIGSRLGKTKIKGSFNISFENLKRTCEVANIVGAKRIRMFSYYMPEDETDISVWHDEVMERLQKLADYANGQGIYLLHENESKIYGEKPDEVVKIQNEIKGMGSIFDPSNYVMEDCDIEECFEKTLPKADYMHIKDCTKEHCIVPSGYGDGKIGKMVSLHSKMHDGDSFLTLEPHLFKFAGYSGIDKHELKNILTFANNNESFDFAVNSLKKVLTEEGFKEGEDLGWTK